MRASPLHFVIPAKALLLTAVGSILLAGIAWYAVDKPGFIYSTCNVGLPNISRPHEVDPETLGCEPLSGRIQIGGIAMDNSVIKSPDFEPFVEDNFDEFLGGYPSVLRCQSEACEYELADRSHIPMGRCDQSFGSNGEAVPWAQVTLEGWVTLRKGNYGHLGVIKRAFFIDRVIAVEPPDEELLTQRDELLERSDLCIPPQ